MSVGGLLLNLALGLAGFAFVLTITGAPVAKFFVKGLTWGQAFRACGFATFAAFSIYLVVTVLLSFLTPTLGLPPIHGGLIGQLAIPALLGCGWLISFFVKRAGFPQSFPGAGTKVVVGWVLMSWVAVGLVWAIGALRH